MCIRDSSCWLEDHQNRAADKLWQRGEVTLSANADGPRDTASRKIGRILQHAVCIYLQAIIWVILKAYYCCRLLAVDLIVDDVLCVPERSVVISRDSF